MSIRIDAHHHFWVYDPAEYGWINDAMSAIRRDFLPGDLKAEIDAAGIDGVVSVQARMTLEETDWLLGFADAHEFIRGVVGWVPLCSPGIRDDLGELAANPKLRAVREVLQEGPGEEYMLREDFNAGIAALRQFDLVYDILIFERQLPQTIEFVDRHPGQVFVLDHIAKPRIRDSILSPWKENITELAERENVYCKLSGMVTEADPHAWTEEQLRPFMEVVLEAFGPKRVMFGSDWPVCTVACQYKRWNQIVREFVSTLSQHQQDRILGETALEAYRL